ncbi:RNA polymerase sigma factor [Paenibacillus sp. J2TS4]|uniref:RNA polymerase sigma factor n=1 Tax=Paenibacillus sp. J2TS4 TaxID=2807194 RepID=UPI001B2C2810|nr:sigma-70 family RNA polymerase sigma factor [Paenibacillus sp. J2TS4]GIP32904.1 RNA polymerase subunit sigma-24 [Paenibacillus sp. J2TS4]
MSLSQEEAHLLLKEMSKGSLEAFELFYESYVPLVYQIALKITGNRMDAEDVCHDLFLEIVNKAEQYDPERGSMEAWLAIRTKSRCLDRIRRNQRRLLVESSSSWFPTERSAEESTITKWQIESLHKAIDQVPETQRAALIGMYFYEQSQKQLAAVMQKPHGTVKSLIRYGVASLRKQLAKMGWLEQPGGVEDGK